MCSNHIVALCASALNWNSFVQLHKHGFLLISSTHLGSPGPHEVHHLLAMPVSIPSHLSVSMKGEHSGAQCRTGTWSPGVKAFLSVHTRQVASRVLTVIRGWGQLNTPPEAYVTGGGVQKSNVSSLQSDGNTRSKLLRTKWNMNDQYVGHWTSLMWCWVGILTEHQWHTTWKHQKASKNIWPNAIKFYFPDNSTIYLHDK